MEQNVLPGRVSEVDAESALVVAPHYDDEVVGCGGLVARLADRGAVVRVLFLSDGRGGAEEVADRDAYAEERRSEAAAAAEVLGVAGLDHLDLPDGSLEHHVEEIAAGLRRALLAQRPDLLLVPSPLEATADHRAAFAALHRLLSPLRREEPGELMPAAERLTVLAYEVNQPAVPDLLVDVTSELGRLEEAMDRYPSQQRRHDYLAAALGLRRYRTLTLATEDGVEAAEGYRRLELADFTTRSPAQLVAHLGGRLAVAPVESGPRVSVVVRTLDRPKLLAEALASLAAGSYRNAQVVLVNDGGRPPEVPEGFPLPLTRVDLPETRGRAAAADAGVAAADGDYVGFLDDDDLVAPEHLAALAGAAAASGARVVYSDAAVAVYELAADGWRCRERRLPYSRDFDPDLLLLDNYLPTHTLLIERSLFAEAGPFDSDLPFFEDWDYWIRLSRLTLFHHLRQVTCEYRHFRGAGHHVLGERPRERSDFLAMKAKVLAKHGDLLTPDLLARAVDRLRAEAVDAREEAAAAAREGKRLAGELAGLAAAHRELSESYHRLDQDFHRQHGELEAQRTEEERLRADLDRLYHEEAALRGVVDDQGAHLGRTYAEIERLNRVIEEMRATRAWQVHEWLERRRT